MKQDLTKGSITKHLLQFTLPIILGNLFQLTYNTVDSIVIGRISGHDALAAVGTADPIMNLVILGINGICIGASVIMSNFFGAGRHEMVKKELAALFQLAAIIITVITAVGLLFAKNILTLMNVPDEILNDSAKYLRIIFWGMPFTCLYNIYASALRSIGDSRTPIIFLAISSFLNIMLDIIFIAFLKAGVTGAASATVIAEGLSALMCIIYVNLRIPMLHLRRNDFKDTSKLIKRTISYGSTTALQQCSQPIGKLLIQGVVNTLGVAVIAAFNAVGKIEDFALVPERSIGDAMMTFTAQNEGAEEKKRVSDGFFRGFLLEICYFVFICIALLLFNHKFLGLFSTDTETITEGTKYFAIMVFFYWMPALTNGFQGFFRGIKHMKVTLAGTITQITVRVIFTAILVPTHGIVGIAYACAAGWAAMLMLDIPYCIHTGKV